jgi:type VI secretion system protein ImpC
MTTPITEPAPLAPADPTPGAAPLDAAHPGDAPAGAGPAKTGQLARILDLVDAPAPDRAVALDDFRDEAAAGRQPKGAMLAAALRVFVDAVGRLDRPVEQVNKGLIDGMIAGLDGEISAQLDDVLHHPAFQHLESSWRGLRLLVDRTDFRRNTRLEVLDVSKDALRESFEDASELYQAGLYKRVYSGAYDQPGADPYGAMISTYEFDNSAQDLALLQQLSRVAAATHCPFVGSVGPRFFGKRSWEEWRQVPDLKAYMESAEYVKWRAFRDTEDSRYVGLAFPRFLLRQPYGPDGIPVKSFNYTEGVGAGEDRFLWGNASFAFAGNLVRAFKESGWCVQIRGPEAGGKVDGLPVHLYDAGRGKEMKPATEILLDETLEFNCADLGFMALSQYVGRDYACFFSAQSAQRPAVYDAADATANSRVNARLPYIFLASRLAHYLKVIQRENIGATKDRLRIEAELNRWLGGYIGEMKNPDERYIAKYPLRAAKVAVHDVEENPGFFRVEMMIIPHFQIEGMDITLSLVSKMPKATK